LKQRRETGRRKRVRLKKIKKEKFFLQNAGKLVAIEKKSEKHHLGKGRSIKKGKKDGRKCNPSTNTSKRAERGGGRWRVPDQWGGQLPPT